MRLVRLMWLRIHPADTDTDTDTTTGHDIPHTTSPRGRATHRLLTEQRRQLIHLLLLLRDKLSRRTPSRHLHLMHLMHVLRLDATHTLKERVPKQRPSVVLLLIVHPTPTLLLPLLPIPPSRLLPPSRSHLTRLTRLTRPSPFTKPAPVAKQRVAGKLTTHALLLREYSRRAPTAPPNTRP